MRFLYVFEGRRLTGIQDVSSWPVRQIDKALTAVESIGRTGEISDKGRAICAVCAADLGEREIPAGQLSHGYCAACAALESEKILFFEAFPEFK